MSRWYAGWKDTELRTKLPLIALVIALAVLGSALPAAADDDQPTNGRISFARFDPELGDWSIWAANPDGSHQRRLTHVPSFFSDWSPDGRWITFNIAPEVSGGGVMAVRPDGSGLRVIRHNNNRFEVYKPVWSPDGRKLLAVCFDVQAQIEKLCTMNANGRNLQVVVATPDFVNFPAWGTHPPKH